MTKGYGRRRSNSCSGTGCHLRGTCCSYWSSANWRFWARRSELDLGVRKLLQGCADHADGHLGFQANNDDPERTLGCVLTLPVRPRSRRVGTRCGCGSWNRTAASPTARHPVLCDQKYGGARRMLNCKRPCSGAPSATSQSQGSNRPRRKRCLTQTIILRAKQFGERLFEAPQSLLRRQLAILRAAPPSASDRTCFQIGLGLWTIS